MISLDDLFASRSSSLPLSGREVARPIRTGLGPTSGVLRELWTWAWWSEGSTTHALYRLAREHPLVMSRSNRSFGRSVAGSPRMLAPARLLTMREEQDALSDDEGHGNASHASSLAACAGSMYDRRPT